jgi:hypothetical protein
MRLTISILIIDLFIIWIFGNPGNNGFFNGLWNGFIFLGKMFVYLLEQMNVLTSNTPLFSSSPDLAYIIGFILGFFWLGGYFKD